MSRKATWSADLERIAAAVESRGTPDKTCPHCEGEAMRWGRAGARQRFRCRSCRRTFNVLTGTIRERSRKPLSVWLAFLVLFREGRTLRECSEQLGIDAGTALRWRHRLLRLLCDRQREALAGALDITTMGFYEATKGRTPPDRPARVRGAFPGRGEDMRMVTVAVARNDVGVDALAMIGRCVAPGSESVLREAISRAAEVHIHISAHRGVRQRLRRLTHSFHEQRDLIQHRPVWRLVIALREWLLRFRGVSTVNMEGYLRWWLAVSSGQLVPG